MNLIRIAVFVGIVGLAYSCGISTHIEIAYRAADSLSPNNELSRIISNNLDAFQAGAPYPDSFYNGQCYKGYFADVSEDTHWTPWMRSAINYVNMNYPKPWNQTAQKLIAFLMGTASHQVADAVWHGSLTGVQNGFIDMEAWVDFQSQEQAAHTYVDPGGDVVANFELDLSYIALVEEWYVPINDLLNIYHLYQNETGHNVLNINSTVISLCTGWLFLGRLAERSLIEFVYDTNMKNATFLQEKYFDFYLGGVGNMHTVTQQYWQRLQVELDNGTSACIDTFNPIDLRCNGTFAAMESPRGKSRRPVNLPPRTDIEPVFRYTPEGNVYISARKIKEPTPPREEAEKVKTPLGAVPTQTYAPQNSYAQSVWKTLPFDINGDGLIDVLYGVPSYNPADCANEGRVFGLVNYNGSLDGDSSMEKAAALTLKPQADVLTCGGRFGQGLAAVDWNKDGLLDLVVGSPSLGIQNNTYSGALYIYYSVKGKGIPSTPSTVVYGTGNKRTLGWKLTTGDIDNDGLVDLVASSPFDPAGSLDHGSVAVFLGKNMPSAAPSYTLQGSMPHTWFGYDVHIAAVGNQTFLLVGAPYEEDHGHGRVIAYVGTSTTPKFVIRGVAGYDRLGHSIRTGYFKGPRNATSLPHLVVSAVTASNRPGAAINFTGRVYIFSESVWGSSGVVQANTVESTQIDGAQKYQRLGWDLAVADLNGDKIDDLIVTGPLALQTFLLVATHNTGFTYVFYGGANFLAKYYPSSCGIIAGTTPCIDNGADLILNSGSNNDRFGSAISAFDIGGDGRADLFISASMSSVGARVSGAVFYFKN